MSDLSAACGAVPPDRHTEANMTEAAEPATDSAEIPAFILSAMTDQMRAVLDLQATRAEECAQAGRRAISADMDADTARLAAMRAEYRAERRSEERRVGRERRERRTRESRR